MAEGPLRRRTLGWCDSAPIVEDAEPLERARDETPVAWAEEEGVPNQGEVLEARQTLASGEGVLWASSMRRANPPPAAM